MRDAVECFGHIYPGNSQRLALMLSLPHEGIEKKRILGHSISWDEGALHWVQWAHVRCTSSKKKLENKRTRTEETVVGRNLSGVGCLGNQRSPGVLQSLRHIRRV